HRRDHGATARARGHRRNIRSIGNARRERLPDRIGGMAQRSGLILAEAGHLRQRRAGHQQRAVVVARELDRIVHHFSPRSFRILLTSPLPSSLRLPCIGSWLLRSPRRTVKWPLPPLWVSKVQPLEASSRRSSCAFMTYSLFH